MAKKQSKGLPVAAKQPVPVRIVHAPDNAKPDAGYEARKRKYRAEDALRDIERAEGHKRNKELMGDVKKLAKEKVNSLKKIC